MESNEAPMSVSITIYYRGVSMTITKRDSDAKIQPLVVSQMKLIDWMLDEKQAKPSWNSETNKEVLGESQMPQGVQKKSIPNQPEQIGKEANWLEEPIKPIITRENWCSIHKIEMKVREGKFGTFYSHSLGKNNSTGKFEWCNGKVK